VSGPAVGVNVSARTVNRPTSVAGSAATALQKAEHAAGATPFSSPAHPLHLPCMGSPPDEGMSLARVTVDLIIIPGPPRPCVTRPMTRTRVINKADICRRDRANIGAWYSQADAMTRAVNRLAVPDVRIRSFISSQAREKHTPAATPLYDHAPLRPRRIGSAVLCNVEYPALRGARSYRWNERTYRVNWRVLSVDTHTTNGNFAFQVGQ
jgi:hypothetical protein